MAQYKDYGFPDNAAAHTFSYLTKGLVAMVGEDRKQNILDLGCGNGYLANFLISKGYNVYGTDASADGIAIAQQTNQDRFYLQDLSTGHLPTELQAIKFDTIISTEVIEHLYDPEGFIKFCKQVLGANGCLIISTPYHGYIKNLTLTLLNKWDTHMNPMWHGGHIKLWSRSTLSRALTDAGFTVVAFKGCGRIPYLWKSMIIKAKLN